MGQMFQTHGGATTLALLAWFAYVACEPYVRRLWPEALVSWTRVLAGRVRDPLVGRDVLVGCTIVTVQGVVATWGFWGMHRAGVAGLLPLQDSLVLIRGGRYAVGQMFQTLLASTAIALVLMMFFLLLRMIFRKTWIAGAVLIVLMGAIGGLQFTGLWGPRAGVIWALYHAFAGAVILVVLLRFGLLALVAYMFFGALGGLGLTILDTSSPLFGTGLLVTGVAFAFAAYGFQTSLAGRPLMRDSLLQS